MLALLTLIQTGMSGLQFALIALLPVVKADLGVGVARTAVLASAVSAGALLAAVPAGQVATRFGERRTLVGGGLLAGTAMLVAATLSNTWLMLVPLLVVGLGVVTSHPAGVRLIMRGFGPRERGGAISIRQTAVPLGGVLTALALPPIAEAAGWRAAIVVAALTVLALAGLARALLPPDEGQTRTVAPGARMGALLRNRGVMAAVALSFVFNIAQVAGVTFIALWAHDSLDRSVTLGAVLLALVQASGIVGRILWGITSDRLHHGRRKPLLYAISAGALASFLLLAVFGRATPVALLVGAALLVGFTAVAWNGLTIALATEAAGLAGAATAMSFIVVVVSFVNTAVPIAGGLVIDATGSYRTLWLASAAILLLAPVLTAMTREGEIA